MTASYNRAPEVADIAMELIANVDDHQDLQYVDIVYVWRDEAAKSKGKTVGRRCPACHRWTRRKRRTMSAAVSGRIQQVTDDRCAICVKRHHYPEVVTT